MLLVIFVSITLPWRHYVLDILDREYLLKKNSSVIKKHMIFPFINFLQGHGPYKVQIR